jgi:hypothetical protein
MAASSRRSHLESASMKPAGDHSSTIRCWASNMPTRLYLPREITRPEREQEGREGERESVQPPPPPPRRLSCWPM